MNKRNGDRFPVSKEWFQKKKEEGMYFLWEGDSSIKARVVDLNLYGIGFEIDTINMEQIHSFRSEGELFIELFLGKQSITASVSIMWDDFEGKDKTLLYKGGLRIEIISPDDKLILFNIIETIRDSGYK